MLAIHNYDCVPRYGKMLAIHNYDCVPRYGKMLAIHNYDCEPRYGKMLAIHNYDCEPRYRQDVGNPQLRMCAQIRQDVGIADTINQLCPIVPPLGARARQKRGTISMITRRRNQTKANGWRCRYTEHAGYTRVWMKATLGTALSNVCQNSSVFPWSVTEGCHQSWCFASDRTVS